VLAFTPIVPNALFVAKPLEMSFADAMLGLRTWLDHKKIQPTGFKLVTGGRIGFEITFSRWHSRVLNGVPMGSSPHVIDSGFTRS
jgi:hypothetical protein